MDGETSVDADLRPRERAVDAASHGNGRRAGAGARVEEGQVRRQLVRILASPELVRCRRLQSFLSFVVEETLAGRGDRLKGYTVGVEVFERGSDFDPATDPLVRNHAGRLRHALEHYYLTRGAGDPVRIEVPKGGYRPRFSHPGPEGHGTRAAVQGRTGGHCPAIAVLPLTNLDSAPEGSYFAQGLTEELIVRLARLRNLRILGLHAAPGSDVSAEDPLAPARRQGVPHVVRGSVRWAGRRVRVTVHLVDAHDGAELWVECYERPLSPDTLLAVQDDIASQVTSRLAAAYHGA